MDLKDGSMSAFCCFLPYLLIDKIAQSTGHHIRFQRITIVGLCMQYATVSSQMKTRKPEEKKTNIRIKSTENRSPAAVAIFSIHIFRMKCLLASYKSFIFGHPSWMFNAKRTSNKWRVKFNVTSCCFTNN